jgi:MFS family permease
MAAVWTLSVRRRHRNETDLSRAHCFEPVEPNRFGVNPRRVIEAMMTKPAVAPKSRTADVALLAILSLVYGIQYLDQILLGMFIQPIKTEFALSDTQAGLLTGLAFTALYVVMGLPVARLADRGNRKLIVLASAVIFSGATIACGLAAGFLSLFAMRMLVAVGEAGTIPASVSMLADAFPPSKRRLVMSFHSCGAFFGTAIGLLFVGLVSSSLGWRHIFGIAGAFGLFLALLVALFIREPARINGSTAPRTFYHDFRKLIGTKPYVLITLSLAIISISSSAAINWVPAFLARSFGMEQRHIVLFLAAVWGLGATSGGVAAGFLTNWLYTKGGRWPLLVVGSLMILFPAMCGVAFMATRPEITLMQSSSGARSPCIAPKSLLSSSSRSLLLNCEHSFALAFPRCAPPWRCIRRHGQS